MKNKFYIANALIGFMFLGLIYAWSVFVGPLEAEFGWVRSQTSLNFSMLMVTFCLGGLASGVLLKTKTPRQVVIFSGLSILAGFILASRMQTLPELYLSYGVLCGFGCGVGYNAMLSTTVLWFPGRQGFVTGILLMGYSMGSFLLGSGAFFMINAMGWRKTFAVAGVVVAGLVFLVSLSVKRPVSGEVPLKTSSESEHDFTPGEMLRDRSFYANYARYLLTTAIGMSLMSNAVPFAYFISREATFAAVIGGLVSLFNGLGRVALGAVFDKIGSRKTMLLCIGGMFLGTLMLVFAMTINSVILLTVGYVTGGFFYGGNVTSNQGFIGRVYGLRDFAVNSGIMNTSVMFAAFAGPYIIGVLITRTGGYLIPYVTLLGMCYVSFVIIRLITNHYVPKA